MKHFNIRVYGIIEHNMKVLVADEQIKDRMISKFPGGGLEFGEGTIDCLKREFREELDLEILDLKHFYTTDFFVESAFNPQSQVVSIYYKVSVHPVYLENIQAKENIGLRWLEIETISENDFTFAIDKKVAILLKNT